MNLAALVVREILHRRASATLFVAAVALAVGAAQVFVVFTEAAEAETRRIQRDSGLNVVILPAATPVDRYHALGYSEHTMPAEHLARIADQDVANRLVPLLKRRIEWSGRPVMLTGIAPEIFKRGERMKPVFGMRIEPGSLVVGAAVGEALALAAGGDVELLGEAFTVASVLAPSGTAEDGWVFADLADAQRLLGLEGEINEVQALECHCAEDVADPLAALTAEITALLPGTRVIRRERAADARRRQRGLAEREALFVTPIVVVLCGLWIATLALQNVRERRAEIGVFAALGRGGGAVAALFLGRAALLGVCGAVLGSLLGSALFRAAGPFVLGRVPPLADVAPAAAASLVLAPVFAVVASLVPIAIAATEDPAELLRDE